MKTFKRFLASLMVAVMVLTAAPLSGFVGLELNLDWLSFDWLDFNTKVNAEAYSGTCGESLTWSLDTESGELVISGTGAMYNYSSSSDIPWYSYRSSIKKVTLGDSLANIGDYAFYGCTGLTSITIPDGVTSIGDYAFYNCTSLTSITIPDSVTSIGDEAFYECTSLTSITIPDGVTIIGAFAFYGCTSLTSITIPDSVTSIGRSAFYECTSLTSITIPDGVTSIGDYVFYNCTSLTSITVPDSVTSIGSYAFNFCYSLTSITIPDSVTSIGDSAFYYCTKLTSITIPDSVTSIGRYAFYNCSGIKELTMPISAKIYNSGTTFGGCTNIEKITLTKGNGTAQNYGTSTSSSSTSTYYQYTPWYISGSSEVIIEDGVTGIGSSAFYNCSGIKELTMPASVKIYNSSYTFGGCTNIEKITLTKGTGIMSDYSTMTSSSATYYQYTPWYISGCSEVIIEDGVTGIGSFAFYNCSGITELTMPASVEIYNSSYTFGGCTNIEKIILTKGTGIMPDYGTSTSSSATYTYYQYTPWYISREKCTELTLEYGINYIGDYAFYNCHNIKTVYYPGTIEQWQDITIGCENDDLLKNTIVDCDSERSCYAPGTCGKNVNWVLYTDGELIISGNGAMLQNYPMPWSSYISEIKTVTIENGVSEICAEAFADCTNLVNITIPKSLKYIGLSAFENTGYYNDTANWENGMLYIEEFLIKANPDLSGYCKIKDGTVAIATGAFKDCAALTEVEMPLGLKHISDSMFSGCASLESIEIPDSVTTLGNYAFYNCTALTEISIPYGIETISGYAFYGCTSLESIEIPDSVKNYESYAFYNCTALTEISIPFGMEDIKSHTFYGCKSVLSINIPNSVTSIGSYAFGNMSLVTELIIPDSVKSIATGAFKGMNKLEKITLPFVGSKIGSTSSSSYYSNVGTGVLGYVFGCTAQGDVDTTYQNFSTSNYSTNYCYFYIPKSLRIVTITKETLIDVAAFQNCSFLTEINLPNTVTSISSAAFGNCSGLVKLTIPFIGRDQNSESNLEYLFFNERYWGVDYNKHVPKSLKTINVTNDTEIASNAFRECPSIETITLNEGITSIGVYAFYNCSSLKAITIPDTVSRIDDCAFNSCVSMKTVDLGNNPDLQINYNVFDDCNSVESYSIGSSSVNYCTDEYGVLYNKNKSGLIRYPTGNSRTEYTVDSNVAYINENAFENCIYLKTVDLPKDIISIGEYAFRNCTALENVVIPEGTHAVCRGAFEGCTSVKEITIPESLAQLANNAFRDCTGVEKIYYNASNLNAEERKEYVFVNCGKATEGVDVIFGDTVVNIPEYLFGYVEDYYLHDSDTEECVYCGGIGYHHCYIDASPKLKSVTVGKNVESIGSSAFYYNKTLTDLYFNATNCDSANNAFSDCSALNNVVIGENVTKIPSYFITNCDTVVDIVIPEGVKEIGDFAFSRNEELKTVRFESTGKIIIGKDIFKESYNAVIGCKEYSYMHSYADANGVDFYIIDENSVPSFEIKNEVIIAYKGNSADVFVSSGTKIGYGAFEDNKSVKQVTLSTSIVCIYGDAFKNCSSLETIVIPESVTAIGAGAFDGCYNLTIWCYAGSYADSYATANGINVEYIALDIEKDILILNLKSTSSLTASLNTPYAENTGVVWSSTNTSIATVDGNGNVKGIKAGTAVIVATSKEGGLRDYCVVKVVGIEALSTATIDHENGMISGITANADSLDEFITLSDPSCNLSYSTLGTDSTVYVKRGTEVVDAYTIVIFGDVNGDSWYDGQDAIIVDCLANGMLTKDDVSEAVYMAADCNHDGVIDQLDVDLLNQAGTLLANVDQSKPAEVLLETSSAYVEYLDLIDQSPEIEDETDAPEADVETEDTTPEQDANKETNFFEMIMNFIKAIIEMILSRIPVPYK